MNRDEQALFYGASRCDPVIIKHCIASGARKGLLDGDEESPIHAMARGLCETSFGNMMECIAALIDHGYPIDGSGSVTPMRCAIDNGNILLALGMLSKGANPTKALLDAAAFSHGGNGCISLLHHLEVLGANIHAQDSKGLTPLELARNRWGGANPDVVSFLEAWSMRDFIATPESTLPKSSTNRL